MQQMTPQQELEILIRRLRATHVAAEAVVKVWKNAPSHVSFGRFMEDALGKLDDTLAPRRPDQWDGAHSLAVTRPERQT